ncbi:hypothetical protein ILYODFUR_023477 [Ilyodon furcidens]|uniref:Uncharacterized protein n=1 Tax=Ilyodon furcidens TaxID=33524 RepID=A0ABV0UIG9_9TELE
MFAPKKSLFKKRCGTNLSSQPRLMRHIKGMGGYEKVILFIFYLQLWSKPMGEAIHPDCAIIFQHLRAREICSQTRRSEAQNRSDHSGGFPCDMLPFWGSSLSNTRLGRWLRKSGALRHDFYRKYEC